MAHGSSLDQVTIPRWTIRRDPLVPDCNACGTSIVTIRADQREISFCSCHILTDWVLQRPTEGS
ncbi:MAG: hypothetical protein HZB35_04315 [Nitrospirae bacterium]|nr:hypothetical protein [Nitrospirota bacterium]